ncbi:MAG: ribulose-phosphate 3-epimerase [Candidatus Parcubacteria bacterium]|nr:MAG: ribulose-phosphate 3-epimerase [Candidatus Parcubacteria bacterium]
MVVQVIPSVNAQALNELKEKIMILKEVVNHFHVDVAEKKFTGSYETWLNPSYLDFLDENLIIDLHLMLFLKPQEILKWDKVNVRNFILHLEASSNPDGLLKVTKKLKKKIFIAWSPDIDFDFIKKYLDYVNGVLVLGVKPGASGQNFIEQTYDKLSILNNLKKTKKNNLTLMVDGGINLINFKKICNYSPDFIVMGSAIYNSQNPVKTFLEIKNSLKF